jgi:hypothetical protein
MKRFLPWILAACALGAATNLAGSWTSSQEKPKPAKHPAQTMAQKNRQARHAALKAVLPTLKTRLGEAVALAEKETGGTAYSAGVEVIEGKGSIQVNLFVNERFAIVNVDPETKKVTTAAKKEGEEGEGEEAEGGETKDQ